MAHKAEAGPQAQRSVPASVWALGLAGLIPFLASAGALAAGVGGLEEGGPLYLAVARISLAVYGAVILSFLGGAHWGQELAAARPAALAAAVSPSIAGWFAVIVASPPLSRPGIGFSLLILGFVALLAYDLAAVRAGLWPRWYARVRLVLTAGAVASLAAGVWFAGEV